MSIFEKRQPVLRVVAYFALLPRPMKKFVPVLLFLLLLTPFWVSAQQQPQFTHYGFNGMQISPAYAGITNRPEFTSIYRYQWLGYDASFDDGGSPRTLLITAHTPVRLLHGGVGVNLMRDQIGNTTVLSAALSYAYHIQIGETGRLGLGVQGNVNNYKKGNYRAIDANDPSVPFNSSDTKFDVGAGLWYESEAFYAGGGVTNLLHAQYEFADSANTGAGTLLGENHIYVTAGYNLALTSDLTVTPTMLLKHDTESFSFDVGGRATYLEKYWVGLNYRHQEAVSALVGVSLFQDNALRVGYALDVTTFNAAAKAATSHEVMLNYRLPEPIIRFKPPVRTPRYYFSR